MQWTASSKLTFIVILTFFLMVSCATKTDSRFTGSHDTETIRTTWYKCFQIYNLNTKGVNPYKAVIVCDCFVDSVREKYEYSYIEKQIKQGYQDPDYEEKMNRLGDECAENPTPQSIRFWNNQMRLYVKKLVYNNSSFNSNFDLFHQSKLFNHWQDLQSRGTIGIEVPRKEHLF